MVDSLILLDARHEVGVIGGVIRVSQAKARFQGFKEARSGVNLKFAGRAKKCGAESGDPNLRFQPRLPGSVVGEASMWQLAEADKITRVTVPW
jgi:hypothetical protein